MYLADTMTVGMSLAGLPAISVPLPVEDSQLPIGLQITGRQGDDRNVLAIASLFEELA
jgi:aspartyl-tRNA(Asn)/glutamyl-tRNA(Gln) amidotransferase subunit A